MTQVDGDDSGSVGDGSGPAQPGNRVRERAQVVVLGAVPAAGAEGLLQKDRVVRRADDGHVGFGGKRAGVGGPQNATARTGSGFQVIEHRVITDVRPVSGGQHPH
ncbi:MAG: hypothetical protein ABI307_10890, partial [Mycobacterium sp.]